MLAPHLFASALLAACAVVPQARAPAPAQTGADALGFPPARSGWSVPAAAEGRTQSLLALLDALAAATGQAFTMSPGVRARLDASQLDLLGPIDVPPAHLCSFVEALLVDRGFSLGVLHEEPPRLIGVYATEGMPQALPTALVVSQDRIDALTAHPAVYVRVVLDLPSVDVRSLGNSLRMLPDAQSCSVIPLGNSNSILIEGRAGQVYRMASALQTMDEQARRSQPPPSAPGGPPPPEKR